MVNIFSMRSLSYELIFYPLGIEYWQVFTFYKVNLTVLPSNGHVLNFSLYRIIPTAHTSEEKE